MGVNNRAIDLTFGMLTAYMWFSNICSGFLKMLKILGFIDFGSSKISSFVFLGFKNSKIQNSETAGF